MAEIRLEGLSFRYPGAAADTLSELALNVPAGEAHALLGSSGAGKTTLLNLLSGLLSVAPGRLFFAGRDVGGLSPWERGVTQVFQFPVLYEGMTVRENLSFPLKRVSGLDAAARRSNLGGAFTVRRRCDNLRVAVVDDVLTTGATATAVTRALYRAGAREVEIWCLARTPPPT